MSLFDVLRENALSLLFADAAFFRVFTVCLLIIAGWIFHGYAFIPLKQVPGPWTSRIFPLQDRWGRSLQGKRLLQLHQIYGPIVRLGPHCISVQGVDAIQSIYSVSSNWTKPSSTKKHGYTHGVIKETLWLTDLKCRHILEPSLSTEAVAKQQHVILNCADTALTVTEIACDKYEGKVNVLQIARTYAFDLITEVIYGGSWQGRGTHSERKAQLELLDRAVESWGPRGFQWISEHLRPMIKRYCKHLLSETEKQAAFTEFKRISTDSVKAYTEDFLCKPGSSRACLASLIEQDDPDVNTSNPAKLSSLFIPLIIAATDTICATLTFVLWDLARFPDFRKRAAEEVAKFFPSREDMTAIALEELPFLNAFLLESMRFHGIAVSLNERVAPESGTVLHGYFIPGGTSVICDPCCQATDPISFPSPENFDPERWLSAGSKELFDMTMIFSHGDRACLGKKLAQTALRFAVASMLFEFDIELCPETNGASIQALKNDISRPWRRKLILRFEQRLQSDEDLDMQGYSIIDP